MRIMCVMNRLPVPVLFTVPASISITVVDNKFTIGVPYCRPAVETECPDRPCTTSVPIIIYAIKIIQIPLE